MNLQNPCSLVALFILALLAPVGCGEPPASDRPAPVDDGDAGGEPDATASEPEAQPEPEPEPEPEADPSRPQVETRLGPVIGVVEGEGRSFKGIPFAAPPVGDLRWRPPQPAAPWEAPLEAKLFGSSCRQPVALGGALTGDEDCLTLNVWSSNPAPEGAPVMVWIHGGGFALGAGSEPLYHGEHLAADGAVVVTINYRLGPFGFLAHEALAAEDPHAVGNYGLLDQIAALEWVRDNIAAFGGDPDNVTIFGESAGAVSACLHLVTPASRGLFHRAIIESGPCVREDQSGAEEARADAARLAEIVGCEGADDVAACLRGADRDALMRALPIKQGVIFGEGVLWKPLAAGALYPADVGAAIEAGDVAQVPVIIGHNKDEGTLFVALTREVFDEARYEEVIREAYGERAEAVLSRYPASDFSNPSRALAEVAGDDLFVCGTRRTARALSEAGLPVWTYHFTREVRFSLFPDLGAFHSAEIMFIFQNSLYGTSLKEEERPLSALMRRYWTGLADGGDPNGGDDPRWPRFEVDAEQFMGLDLEVGVGERLKAETCDFWDALPR